MKMINPPKDAKYISNAKALKCEHQFITNQLMFFNRSRKPPQLRIYQSDFGFNIESSIEGYHYWRQVSNYNV